MAEIYNKTGVTTSGKIEVKKGFASLVIASTKAITQNEKISIKVQRRGGVESLAKDIPLLAFNILGTSAFDTMQYDANLGYFSIVELTEANSEENPLHPNISLNGMENEIIEIELTNLDDTATYALYTMESPLDSDDHELLKFYHRVIHSSTLEENIDTRGFDSLVIARDASIKEVELTYDSAKRITYTPKELDFLSTSNDPFQDVAIRNQAVVPCALNTSYHVIDLQGVLSVQINKSATQNSIDVILKIDQSDAELYNVNR